MGNKYCVIISPAVMDDSLHQSPEQQQKYRGFVSNLRRYETIANSLVGERNVIKLYGTRATKKRITTVLNRFAGIKDDFYDFFPEEEWTLKPGWKVEDADQVFVIFCCHGSHLLGEYISGYRLVWPDIRVIPAYDKWVTTFRAYHNDPPELYKGNPLPYNRGLEEGLTNFIVDGSWVHEDRVLTKAEFEEIKRKGDWRGWFNQNKYYIALVNDNKSKIELKYPNTQMWCDNFIISIPNQKQIQEAGDESTKLWARVLLPDNEIIVLDKDGQEVLHDYHVFGVIAKKGEMLRYTKCIDVDKDTDDRFYSYLPPPGDHRVADTMSGVLVTQIGDSRFFTDMDLYNIAKHSKTNMFFIVDACYAGRFADMTDMLMKENPRCDFGSFVASRYDRLNWGGWHWSNIPLAAEGHFCSAIYNELFYPLLGKIDIRVDATYRKVFNGIEIFCSSGKTFNIYDERGRKIKDAAYIPEQKPQYRYKKNGVFSPDVLMPEA